MSRKFYIHGESMIAIKGSSGNATLANGALLGLSDSMIRVALEFHHRELQVEAFGGEVPLDLQYNGTAANISMTLVHYDPVVVDALFKEVLPGSTDTGKLGRAGTLMGGNDARYGADWHYCSVHVISPHHQAGDPNERRDWQFLNCYLTGNMDYPLGTERTILTLNFRAIPYAQDPWGASTGMANVELWNHDRPADIAALI